MGDEAITASMSASGTWRTSMTDRRMSASLIGRFGSSAFRLSTAAVVDVAAGSCFSPESAPGPFHHGVRERGGTIYGRPCRQTDGRSSGHCDLTSSVVPRGTSCHRAVELAFSPIGFDLALSCGCSLLSGPAELGAVNPDAVHDHSQSACQRNDCLFPAAPPGDLHRPGLEPGPSR